LLIRQLRADGERVIVDLTDTELGATDQHCDRQILQVDGAWTVKEV